MAWVNWGDFINANSGQLADYNQRVGATQAAQNATFNRDVASYSSAAMAAAPAYEGSSASPGDQASLQRQVVNARNQANRDATAGATPGFTGYSGSSPWESALYGAQTQYSDPWAGLSGALGTADASAASARSDAQTRDAALRNLPGYGSGPSEPRGTSGSQPATPGYAPRTTPYGWTTGGR